MHHHVCAFMQVLLPGDKLPNKIKLPCTFTPEDVRGLSHLLYFLESVVLLNEDHPILLVLALNQQALNEASISSFWGQILAQQRRHLTPKWRSMAHSLAQTIFD